MQEVEDPIPMRPILNSHGETMIAWKEAEVMQKICKENLQCPVIDKFSYGMLEIKELPNVIPTQYELKGECNIGVLVMRNVLICASNMEDYVKLLSKPITYLTLRDNDHIP